MTDTTESIYKFQILSKEGAFELALFRYDISWDRGSIVRTKRRAAPHKPFHKKQYFDPNLTKSQENKTTCILVLNQTLNLPTPSIFVAELNNRVVEVSW